MKSMSLKPYTFLWNWVMMMCSFFVLTTITTIVVFIIIGMVSFPFILLGYNTDPGENLFLRFVHYGFAFLAPSIIGSSLLGIMQVSVLEKHFNWRLHHWAQLSAIGGSISGLMIFLIAITETYLPFRITYLLYPFVPIICALSVSSAQWWTLRDRVHHAGLWVVANVVGTMIFILFLSQAENNSSLLFLALAAIAPALLTGIVMFYLYSQKLRDDDHDGEFAPVYVDIRHHD